MGKLSGQAYQNSISQFIGNETEIPKLVAWLNDFFEGDTKNKVGIVHGNAGSGKTTLVQLLASLYKVPLLHITPTTVRSKEDVNELKKSLNIVSIERKDATKIILIDDLNEYDKRAKIHIKLMKEIPKLSNQPIIYTIDSLKGLPPYFKKGSIICKLALPEPVKLKKFLRSKAKQFNIEVSPEYMTEITKNAPSVSCAINSLLSPSVCTFFKEKEDIYSIRHQIGLGELKQKVESYVLSVLALNAKDYRSIKFLADLDFKSNFFLHKRIPNNFLLNNANLKFEGHIKYYRTQLYNREPNEEEQKVCEELHISSRILRSEYRFLLDELEQKKPKQKVKVQKIEKKAEPSVKALSSFY